MRQLILIKDIEQSKMKALIDFLKSWNIDAELVSSSIIAKKESKFTLSAGLWKDYNIDSKELRAQAWNRKK
ncbi:MAG: hypothetical protein WAU01_01185 [Saprospiraceae bacterium]